MEAKKIVVIDDEIDLTELLKIELETEGYEVFTATDGKSGLALIRDTAPSLILLDVMMPVMNGYETLQALKQDPQTRDIPVFLLTAIGEEDAVNKGLTMGASDYVLKPFHSELLLKRIEMTLKNEGKTNG